MIIIHIQKKVSIQHQLPDYCGQKTIIHLTWERPRPHGLVYFLREILGGVRQGVTCKKRKKFKFQPLEKILCKTAVQEEEKKKNDVKTPNKKPYRLGQEVQETVLKIQSKNLQMGYRKVSEKVEEEIGIKISHESARMIIKKSPLGLVKKFIKKIYVRSAEAASTGNFTPRRKDRETQQEVPGFKCSNSKQSQREQFFELTRDGLSSQYAALLLLVAYFPQIGFYELAGTLSTQRQKGFSDLELMMTLFYMPLIDCSRLEHFENLPLPAFMVLIGKNGIPRADCLRAYLNEVVTNPWLKEIIDSAYQGWAERGLIKGQVIYLDGHGIEYYGKKNLEKIIHGVKKKAVKGIMKYTSYEAIHNRPITNHFQAGNIKLSPLVLTLVEETEGITGQQVGLVVFDRQGNKIQSLVQLRQRGTHFICWTKDNYTAVKELKKASQKNFLIIKQCVTAACQKRQENKGTTKTCPPSSILEWTQKLTEQDLLDYLKRSKKKLTQHSKDSSHKRQPQALWDTEGEVKGYGLMRIIIVQQACGKEIGIYTSLPAEHISAIEVLLWLSRRWREENFFKVQKGDLAADNVPSWAIFPVEIVAPLKAGSNIEQCSVDELLKIADKLEDQLAKNEEERQKRQQLYEKGEIYKIELKQMQKRFDRLLLEKRETLATLLKQISLHETGETTSGRNTRKIVERVDLSPFQFLTTFRDMLGLACQLLAQDLALCLMAVGEEGKNSIPKDSIHETAHLTPRRLTHLLFQQGAEVQYSPKENTLYVRLPTPRKSYLTVALAKLCEQLNERSPSLYLGRKVEFSLHYSIH
jgi:hypothetical protein